MSKAQWKTKKPDSNKRYPVTVKLPQSIIDWLRGNGQSQGKLIEEALIAHFNIKDQAD